MMSRWLALLIIDTCCQVFYTRCTSCLTGPSEQLRSHFNSKPKTHNVSATASILQPSIMGSAYSTENDVSIECALRVDTAGEFAGLIPIEGCEPAESRDMALVFAQELVDKVGKNFDSELFELVRPKPPGAAADMGIHCSTHNHKFHGGRLTDDQIDAINANIETFTLKVLLNDYKVLVGSPSNDINTGVVGYVGLLIHPDSLVEYNKAVAVYNGVERKGNIPHVSACGWNILGFTSTTDGREAFNLITKDGQLYPDGEPFYTGGCFPTRRVTNSKEEHAEVPDLASTFSDSVS
jgi:hypothetical protein